MSIYALAPLIAIFAYIPIFASVISNRPFSQRQKLFLYFILAALMWNILDYVFRGMFFMGNIEILSRVTVSFYAIMVMQLHIFVSSFYPQHKSRWLPAVYIVFTIVVALILAGYVTGDVSIEGEIVIIPYYGTGIFILVVPLVVLLIRNLYVLIGMYKASNSPIARSQISSLIVCILILAAFSVFHIVLPVAKEFPLVHYGNLINIFMLSYAVTRHQLVDIKLVLRQTTAWVLLCLIGITVFLTLLVISHALFNYAFDFRAYIITTGIAVIVAFIVYKIRVPFMRFMTKAFQGPSYNYRRRLSEFSDQIHNVFSLKEQGGELLTLLVGALNIKQACLLFLEIGSDEFTAQFSAPRNGTVDCLDLRLRAGNPIIKYLQREGKILPRENLAVLPAFLGMWPQEKEDIEARNISMFVPLISRERLIAIMVLGDKLSGRFTLEDFTIIEDVTSRVAVSMEKEYLREQLREREEELSVINNSSVILTSSLDIQDIFNSFLEELKKVIDIAWSTIILIEDDELRCAAISSLDTGEYKPGDKVPMEGTGTGWVVMQKKLFIEPDLEKDHSFESGEHFRNTGLRTMVYLPLVSKGNAIGCFIIASRQAYAYSQRHVKLLEQIASQIALPLENAQLYARAEKRARIDELTGLLNRRSLDEMIDNEISRHSRYGGVFSLMIIDLDRFKPYNDTYGHLSGDNLLRDVGKAIKLAIRDSDRAFRYGGDEFAVLLPQTDGEAATQVAERVRLRINSIDTKDVRVTASIGTSNWPEDGVSHMEIIATADESLYHAKRVGGNQVINAATMKASTDTVKPVQTSRDTPVERITDIVFNLARTVDERSDENTSHSTIVAENALLLGRALGLSEDDMSNLEIAARLHDIGKIGISASIQKRKGMLSTDEEPIIKSHPQLGAEIVSNIPQLTSCREAILHHHEMFNGEGYPDGLKGEDIPLAARVLAIADTFARLMTESADKATTSMEDALHQIQDCSGSMFDPKLVELFTAAKLGNTTTTSYTGRR